MFIGILYLFLTFAVCFILVHVIKLAYIGLLSTRKKPQPPPAKEEKPQQNPNAYKDEEGNGGENNEEKDKTEESRQPSKVAQVEE